MANYSWPITLPSEWLEEGYSEEQPSIAIRTQMDVGPAKSRGRVTTNVKPIERVVIMTSAQLTIFDDFFQGTLSGGVSEFDAVHPRLGTIDLRFSGLPRAVPIGGGYYKLTMRLEIMP